jgi:hypothetical protein
MKTVALTLLLVLVCGLSAFASDCIVTSYDNYLGPGFSCGLEDKTASNFFYSTAGTNQMPASSITVNPITEPLNPGFLFNAPWGVQGSQTQDSLIGFTITANGNLINDLSLWMFGGSTLGNGLVTVSETYCAGDTFANGCANGTTGTLSTYLGGGLSKLYDSVTFDPVKVVDVKKDIELLGGGNGSFAVLSGVQNQFSEVPEPGSLMLFGSGIAGLAGVLRRYVKL